MKKWLQRLANALKELAGKAVEALPAIVGSVVGALLSFLGKTVGFVAEHTWALIVFVAGLVGWWSMQKVKKGYVFFSSCQTFLYSVIRHKIMILSIFLGDVTDTLLQITHIFFSMFSLNNLKPGHRLPCILPSSTSLDLISSYMGLSHLLQMILHRSSLSTHISRFHHCEQPFFPSI